MEGRLSALFDFQRFLGNKRLARIIENAQQQVTDKLDDEDLSFVAAAGELFGNGKEGKCHDD